MLFQFAELVWELLHPEIALFTFPHFSCRPFLILGVKTLADMNHC
jgi:hypothetical protein